MLEFDNSTIREALRKDIDTHLEITGIDNSPFRWHEVNAVLTAFGTFSGLNICSSIGAEIDESIFWS